MMNNKNRINQNQIKYISFYINNNKSIQKALNKTLINYTIFLNNSKII